ncbi:hypothetical protein [Kitasatospora sp. NPDC088134]|uniref:hypothetical protein n=1 Tax=Kitasatospora sp. NPDC088134 TaxID=3364071 RepID=UPI0037FDE1E2
MADLDALAAMGANTLAEAIGTDTWGEVRDRLARLLARTGTAPDGQAETLADLDRTAEDVAAAAPHRAEQDRHRAADAWQHRFLDLLEHSVGDDREALLAGLEELAALARDRPAGSGTGADGGTTVTDPGEWSATTDAPPAADRVRHTFASGLTISGTAQSTTVHYPPYRPPLRWPLLIGSIPPSPAATRPRPDLHRQIGPAPGGRTTAATGQVLSGGAGTGKSQLAAEHARESLADGTDLVVWADAGDTAGIVAAYARAAAMVQITGDLPSRPEEDALTFLNWLAVTDRSWLVVLDGLTDLDVARQWWPRSTRGGQVLATTRRRDAQATSSGQVLVGVGPFTATESVAYLRERLASAGASRLADHRTAELAERLGHLPLALAHAATFMIDDELDCSAYLALLTDPAQRLDDLLPLYTGRITTTLLAELESADRRRPAGLATPALRLAAHLDPAGHPGELWATAAVRDHLGADPDRARAAMRLLHQHHLLQHADDTVRLHPLTARAAREATPADELPALARTLTEALAELRTALPTSADPVLDANAAALATHLPHLVPTPATSGPAPEPPPATNLYGLFT